MSQDLHAGSGSSFVRRALSPAVWLLTAVLVSFTVAGPAARADQEEGAADREALLATVSRFEEEIERLQGEQGPYDRALGEVLVGLGETLQKLDRHSEAAAAFEQALHIERVSDGLFSPGQLPLLEELVESHGGMQSWEAVDANHHLAWHISSRIHEPHEPAYAEALVTFGNWKLDAWRQQLIPDSKDGGIGSIRELKLLYEDALERSQEPADSHYPARLALLSGRAQAEYVLASHVVRLPLSYFRGTTPEYRTETVCQHVRTASGEVVRSCRQIRRENPYYLESLRREKRHQLRYALTEMEKSIREMEELLEADPGLASETLSPDQLQPVELNALYAELIRDSRRSLASLWF